MCQFYYYRGLQVYYLFQAKFIKTNLKQLTNTHTIDIINSSIMNQKFPQEIACIIKPVNNKGGIFISNIEVAENPQTLKNHNIGAVITAIKGKNLSDVIPKSIEYLYIPAVDHQSFDISDFFKVSNQFIDEERQRTNILVHCMAGISRSVTLVIAYLMFKDGLTMKSAFKFVKDRRGQIFPNDSFIEQLNRYQVHLKEQKYNFKNKKGKRPLQATAISQNTVDSFYQKKSGSNSNFQEINTNFSTYDSNMFKNSNTSSNFSVSSKFYDDSPDYDKNLKQNIKKLFMTKNLGTSEMRMQEKASMVSMMR